MFDTIWCSWSLLYDEGDHNNYDVNDYDNDDDGDNYADDDNLKFVIWSDQYREQWVVLRASPSGSPVTLNPRNWPSFTSLTPTHFSACKKKAKNESVSLYWCTWYHGILVRIISMIYMDTVMMVVMMNIIMVVMTISSRSPVTRSAILGQGVRGCKEPLTDIL